MSLVRINQFSLHFFALIKIRGRKRRLLPSVQLGRAALPDIFSIIIIIIIIILLLLLLYYIILYSIEL